MRRFLAVAAMLLLFGCAGKTDSSLSGQQPESQLPPTYGEGAIPGDAVKMAPETDIYPPILHSDELEAPVPLPYPFSTAGAEDSAFIMPDGNTLYVFFTPDVRLTPEEQVVAGITGIYVSHKDAGEWSKPERVVLQDAGKLALDGCEFVQGNTMWFCSAREGYAGVNLFTAQYADGKWSGWQPVEDILKGYEVGEMHLSADGNELYFHSPRAGGFGQFDIWVTEKLGGAWQEPENLRAVNTAENEGWPFLSEDGKELWFTRFYNGTPAIFRSSRAGGAWSEPELIVSQFAGEPTLDREGNLYFTHHFYENGTMIEADIYVAYKK